VTESPSSPASIEEAPRRGRLLGLLAVALGGVGVHLWFIAGADALDTDRATVLLMARRFAEGELVPYFWAQNYMGALEPLLMAPLALLGWATPGVAGLVALGLTLVVAACTVRLATRVGAPAWIVVALWALPSAPVAHHHVSLYGARLATGALVAVALVASMGARSRLGWWTLGLLSGLAYFGDHLMLPWVAAVAWVAARRGGLRPWTWGALPVVLLDTVLAARTPAYHLSGPNDPFDWLWNLPRLVTVTLPQLFGLLNSPGPVPIYRAPASVLPTGWVGWLLLVVGLGTLATVGGTLIRRWRAWLGLVGTPEEKCIRQALALVVMGTVGLYAFTGGGGDPWTVRYLVPLWPPLTIWIAWGLGRWPPVRRLALLGLLLPAAWSLVASEGDWPPRGDDGAVARAEAATVQAALAPHRPAAVWADYWDTYRLSLHLGEPPHWVPLTVIDRRPEVRDRAEEAAPAAYLLPRAWVDGQEAVLRGAQASDVAIWADTTVVSYRLVVTERAVSGVVERNPPPSRARQLAAALGAGLLFLMAVAVVARGAPRVAGRTTSDTPA